MRAFAAFVAMMVVVVAVWAVHTSRREPFALKRSTPVRIIRWISGEGGSEQWVNDLCDELSKPGAMDSVRSWAQTVLKTHADRTVDASEIEGRICRALEAQDVPPPSAFANFEVEFWRPVTFLHYDVAGRVDGAILSWGNLRAGIIIAPAQALSHFEDTLHQIRASDDMLVFSTFS